MKLDLLISKYYERLTSTQYLYQEELKNPSSYLFEGEDTITPRQKYHCEIELIKNLIKELEELKNDIEYFTF